MQIDEASNLMYEKSGFKHKGISDRFIFLKNGALETAREICYFLRGRKIEEQPFPSMINDSTFNVKLMNQIIIQHFC